MVGAVSIITEIISNLKLKLNILQNKCHFKFYLFCDESVCLSTEYLALVSSK